MKRKTFIISLMMALLPLTSICVYADPTGIQLEVRYDDPIIGMGGMPRTPIPIPEVSIENYTLYFDTPCDGCILRLVNAEDEVEYTTVIPANAASLVLPAYLEGEYEIQIVQGEYCFYGFIEL